MELTVGKTSEDRETFDECFEYLGRTLSSHYLLTETERRQCASAVQSLRQVF